MRLLCKLNRFKTAIAFFAVDSLEFHLMKKVAGKRHLFELSDLKKKTLLKVHF